MARYQPAKVRISTILSVIVLVILAIGAIYISGVFPSLNTAIKKTFAGSSQPVITNRFIDAFKDSIINTDRWEVNENGAKVTETASDNLRINVNSGKNFNAGNITFKQQLKKGADFRVTVVMYRPVVQGDGQGSSGIAFSSAGKTDKEAAAVVWMTDKTGAGKVVFSVISADGTQLIRKEQELHGTMAVLQLTRVGDYYRGAYSPGRDLTGDTEATVLGEVQDSALGDNGQIRILTNNVGTDNKFPGVVGRFDTAYVYWQSSSKATPAPSNRYSFKDNFGNGVVAGQWTQDLSRSRGVTIVENSDKKLQISIPATQGSDLNRQKYGNLNNVVQISRNDPLVPVDKNFTFNVTFLKPKVSEGVGKNAGVGINFEGEVKGQRKGVSFMWFPFDSNMSLEADKYVSYKNTRVLSSGNVSAKSALQMRIVRSGSTYTFAYKNGPGDPDYDWVTLGSFDLSNDFAGKLTILATNDYTQPSKGKYVFTSLEAQVDTASGSVQK